ncbi:hypothetical protein PR048_000748 [Dryococelus australis]|uniref:Uncharacterized protein n=1 Tax=Dryococelus australis TaxID=614101 RepID=A0ABQ9IGD5_9NEOP|nr:hypothetical protein PR048_000748 [Dryococelus australis]
MRQEYTNPKTKKVVPARVMGEPCVGNQCAKYEIKCADINEAARTLICKDYYNLDELQLQREFIVRHVDTEETKQKTTSKDTSRHRKTNNYCITVQRSCMHVCKTFFLNILAISEPTAITPLNKLTASGVVEKEKRGGRQSDNVISRDKSIREVIVNHISRFPRVESHYCRTITSKEYLHSDLTVQNMCSMFISDIGEKEDKSSISTYHKFFNKLYLAFHSPKKDQCYLCMTCREGDVATKEKIHDRYQKHIAKKTKVREIKDQCKVQSANCFVAHSTYNKYFTYPSRSYYNIANKDCFCHTWHEGESRRGASEVSTVVYKTLTRYYNLGCESAVLFADGYSGQNKNPIVARLARQKQPYIVCQLEHSDFLDFKKLSQDLRNLTI